ATHRLQRARGAQVRRATCKAVMGKVLLVLQTTRSTTRRIADGTQHALHRGEPSGAFSPTQEVTMLYYAIVFFVIALIAAALGFGGLAGAATGIAKILFFVFLILFIASLVFGGVRRR